ncbi:MAG: 4-oxalomesaconate tautomerase [Aestuariivita sp.]|nr:4-oxalomesaconate tautomerase [Aestuariivita sp.]MCY4345435.1 4-oxalomesaconate tautomerase [Aestuariivita sp.]
MNTGAIPFLFMRGGTSRGPYFRRCDLPQNRDDLSKVLMAIMGAGYPQNIDGLGGGTSVTTKVAMLSASDDNWADVDYFFAQVGVETRTVDYKPTCGNILAGVGPAAIEMGLVSPSEMTTQVRIRAVNTEARIIATVMTDQDGTVIYDGDFTIAGVHGTAAPVKLEFHDLVGSVTGTMFPTGARSEQIKGVTVTCMDVTMPMVIARADAFDLTGSELPEDLNRDRNLFARLEAVRIVAGERMGMGDVSKSVTPKVGLISAPAAGGHHARVRYFTPATCHPTLAVTGSQCIAACLLAPSTVAEGLVAKPDRNPMVITLEHPMGSIDVSMTYRYRQQELEVISAGLVRTARKIASGNVFVP